MAGFDPDVFGGGGAGFDPEVFATTKPTVDRKAIADKINNDAISQGARSFAGDGLSGHYLSALGGLVRGAGSIGATLARPFESGQANAQRRTDMDSALSQFGADPNSLTYKGGKLAGEVAGTLGVGGALAAPVRAISSAPLAGTIATALETGGLRVPGLSGAPALATRIAAGGLTGGAAAGLVDPREAATGALVGGALPPVVQGAGVVGQAISDKMRSGASRLMQSAIKPTLAQLKSGDAQTATQVLLERGLNPNAKGVEALGGAIDDVDSQISSAIGNSTAQIDKQRVLNALGQTRQQFTNQVAPQADLGAIQAAQDAFLAHPNYAGPTIPVQDAQALKQGTYRVLAKKYGQMGSADTEAQKAIARGLKDEIATAVPGVSDLNKELSRLITAKEVAERRALMEANKNPLGLAALAPNKAGLLAFLADRSAQMKGYAARGLYSTAPLGSGLGLLDNPAILPYVRGGLLATEATP